MKKYNTWMKNENESVVDGVLAGLANYTGFDPTILRIAFIIALLLSGFTAILIYFLLSWFVVPDYHKSGDMSLQKNKDNESFVKKEKKNSVIKNL
jgi:phage shock protein C